MPTKLLAIVKKSDLTLAEATKYHRNSRYMFFDVTNCFVLKDKLREIKELLDQKKSVAEVNATI